MRAPPRLVSASVCLPDSAAPGPPARRSPCRSRRARSARRRWSSPGRRAAASAGRRRAARPRRVEHRVGEERAGAPGVVVGGVEHHALAARAARAPPRGRRPAAPGRRARRRGRGPARRSATGARGSPSAQLEACTVEDDVAAGLGLEPAGAVAEAAVGGGEGADAVAAPVPDARPRATVVGDLLAVGADVLDRRRPDRARDAGQRLDPDPALGRRRGRRARPTAPRRPRSTRRRRRSSTSLASTPRVRDLHDRARRSPRRRRAGCCRRRARATGVPARVGARVRRRPARPRCRPRRTPARAADPQGGQVGEPRTVGARRHGTSGTRLRRADRGPWPCRAPSPSMATIVTRTCRRRRFS